MYNIFIYVCCVYTHTYTCRSIFSGETNLFSRLYESDVQKARTRKHIHHDPAEGESVDALSPTTNVEESAFFTFFSFLRFFFPSFSPFFSCFLRLAKRVIRPRYSRCRRKRQRCRGALARFSSPIPRVYPERDTSAVTAGNIISLFADSINFGEGNSVRAIYRTCSLRIAGASKRSISYRMPRIKIIIYPGSRGACARARTRVHRHSPSLDILPAIILSRRCPFRSCTSAGGRRVYI